MAKQIMKQKIRERCVTEFMFGGKPTLAEYPAIDLDGDTLDSAIETINQAKIGLGAKYSTITLQRDYSCACNYDCSCSSNYVCYGWREETDAEFEVRVERERNELTRKEKAEREERELYEKLKAKFETNE